MSQSHATPRIHEDTSITEVLAFFLENGLRAAPVWRADSTLAGYVSLADLMLDRDQNMAPRGGGGVELGPGFHMLLAAQRVGDVMTFPAVHLRASIPRTMAAAATALEALGRLPIFDGRGRAVGMLDGSDVLRWLAHQDGYYIPAATERVRGDGRYRH